MSTDHAGQIARLWQSACLDTPTRPSAQVINADFVLRITGNRANWTDLCRKNGVPSTAHQTVEGDTLTARWPSFADQLFSNNGPLAAALPDYEMRTQQIQMARAVQRAIELQMPAVAEAGTGTGKSFAYLVVALAMGKRCVVSTSNKALQMQLIRKDLPFLLGLSAFQGKRVALAQGKSNYLCRHKLFDDLSGSYAVANQSLIDWVESTETGSIEDLPFELSKEESEAILLDDGCCGKKCPRYGDCFYFDAKRHRQDADIVVCNHSLLALHYLYPQAGILPSYDLLVADEAHKLPAFVRDALGIEFSWADLDTLLKKAAERDYDGTQRAQTAMVRFVGEARQYIGDKKERELGIEHSKQFEKASELAAALLNVADQAWPEDQMPAGSEQMRLSRFANRLRSLADKVAQFADHSEGYARWINQNEGFSFVKMPYDVSDAIAGICGVEEVDATEGYVETRTRPVDYTRCTRCGRQLTADLVHVLNDSPYGPDCIRYVDLLGDAELVELSVWLESQGAAKEEPFRVLNVSVDMQPISAFTILLTSATLAAPDMDAFRRECGIRQALEIQVPSPFDYARNALLYVPNGKTPEPSNPAHQDFLLDEIERLVEASEGGTFVLCTSLANMRLCASALRPSLERRGYPIYVQGDMPKLQIAKEFRQHNHAVLFATKSFWEGVSIDGDALRQVIIDKLPFAALSPLKTAREAALTQHARDVLGYTGGKLEFYPFYALSLPEMILDLKQGAGRLIRTSNDYGAICILDSRIHTKKYGRQVLQALPPAPLTADRTAVEAFYRTRRQDRETI